MKKITKRISLLLTLYSLLSLAAPAFGATVTIGDNTGNGFSGTDDAGLKENAATTNYGSSVQVDLHKYGSGDHANVVVRFPGLSNITGPVTVTAATLYLWQVGGPGVPITYNVFRMLRNWSEAQTTWNEYTTGNNWTTAGALGSATDIAASASATPTFNQSVAYQAITSAGLIADVEGMINGTLSNLGWLIERQDAGNDTQYSVVTMSEGTDTQRPYLDITYTAAAGADFFGRRRTASIELDDQIFTGSAAVKRQLGARQRVHHRFPTAGVNLDHQSTDRGKPLGVFAEDRGFSTFDVALEQVYAPMPVEQAWHGQAGNLAARSTGERPLIGHWIGDAHTFGARPQGAQTWADVFVPCGVQFQDLEVSRIGFNGDNLGAGKISGEIDAGVTDISTGIDNETHVFDELGRVLIQAKDRIDQFNIGCLAAHVERGGEALWSD